MPFYKEYALAGGQPVKISPLEVTEPGTVFASEGCAFNPVICNVESSLEEKTATITENTETILTPSKGKIGFSKVSVTTDITAVKEISPLSTAQEGVYVFFGPVSESVSLAAVCKVGNGGIESFFGDGSCEIVPEIGVLVWTPSETTLEKTVWYAASVESNS